MIPLVQHSRKGKIIGTENRSVVVEIRYETDYHSAQGFWGMIKLFYILMVRVVT